MGRDGESSAGSSTGKPGSSVVMQQRPRETKGSASLLQNPSPACVDLHAAAGGLLVAGEPVEELGELGLAGVVQEVEVGAAVGYFPEILGRYGQQLVVDRGQAGRALVDHVAEDDAGLRLGAPQQVVGGQLDLGLAHTAQRLLLGVGLGLLVD